MNLISYPVEERKEEENSIRIRAGVKQVDEQKRIHYEGIELTIPKALGTLDELTFAVLNIKEGKEDEYYLNIHTHQDEQCCEADTTVKVSKTLLKKWTGLSGREIDGAFRSINIGATYNLLQPCLERLL